ncbi:HD domain-containing protein [Hansschlegelia quercus]|uniref:HD domain-containing protein n=1 Tax=Hansschlegelia quercus TaxID=2528245 RepID=A0A4Q9GNT6_9HYPH|nr:HD domain-containing protein [Hansschlegelia quercus]TBN55181.1 HD domain-containing protein [Hansschlegelia quercus]
MAEPPLESSLQEQHFGSLDQTRPQRLRDPVHGLITFRENDLDQLAWSLIDTREFQRLRRIKQLGFSEYIYPGATHTRFSHSIGVFHVARQLIEIIKREISSIHETYDPDKAFIAVIAALLHDVGHGAFSHTFEGVQRSLGASKKHETWSSDIIRNRHGEIYQIIEGRKRGFADKIADLLILENPRDVYHAVVSSSFDADRLDYLRRDRFMTGTHAGAIDFDWLLEHVRIRSIDLDAVDGIGDDDSVMTPTFCLDIKALPAAEQFLLARYTLHEQVYFHKTTRCMEQMMAAMLRAVASEAKRPLTAQSRTGLSHDHPIIGFFGAEAPSVDQYLQLDDQVIMGSLSALMRAENETIRELAKRLYNRRLYKTLDCRSFDSDGQWQEAGAKKVDRRFPASDKVIKDTGASLNIYTQVGGDDEKAHKKIRILQANGSTPEITTFDGITKSLPSLKLTRYYFEDPDHRKAARILGMRK